MVLANELSDPAVESQGDDYGYPEVRRVDVFFWNIDGRVHFQSFYWTVGTHTWVIA